MDNYIRKLKNSIGHQSLTKTLIIKMVWCLVLSLFWVIFVWGIWSKGVYALGINAFVFWLFVLALFFWVLNDKKHYCQKDLAWIIPLALMALSFLIYDNPFIKAVNLFVYPLLFTLFINYGFLSNKEKRHWNFNFIFHFLSRVFSFVGKINKSVAHYFDMLLPVSKKKRTIFKKIFIGVGLFLIIALTLIIPLLSSADTVFAGKMKAVYSWINSILSITYIYKAIVFIILSILLLSSLLAWGRSFDYKEKDLSRKLIDPIVSGIVIGGILGLYILFLWVQIERLWVGSLPFNFNETESLVKSGFWQLLFLSVINIAIYFFIYRKTISLVQKILAVFTTASLLLLISAGHRMGLYVINYGLSYEKFFAAYTVIFCGILFVWLIFKLCQKEGANILKFLVFLFLWMFSVITIFPVEQFIFRANMKLANREESRIRLFEMTMLSPDVLSLVKRYHAAGRLQEKVDYLEREGQGDPDKKFDWSPWIKEQEKRIADKAWYEKNIVNWLNSCGAK